MTAAQWIALAHVAAVVIILFIVAQFAPERFDPH